MGPADDWPGDTIPVLALAASLLVDTKERADTVAPPPQLGARSAPGHGRTNAPERATAPCAFTSVHRVCGSRPGATPALKLACEVSPSQGQLYTRGCLA